MSEARIDIGQGHEVAFFELEGERYGATLYHKAPNGEDCACCLFWARRPDPIWRATSIEPLTLEPSIKCLVCGDHGWIREGKWVSA